METPGTPTSKITGDYADYSPKTPNDNIHTLYGMGATIEEPSSPSPAPALSSMIRSKRTKKELKLILKRAQKMQAQMNELVEDIEDLIRDN